MVIHQSPFAVGNDFGGQMLPSDPFARTQYERVFNGIAQLPNISRPGISQ